MSRTIKAWAVKNQFGKIHEYTIARSKWKAVSIYCSVDRRPLVRKWAKNNAVKITIIEGWQS